MYWSISPPLSKNERRDARFGFIPDVSFGLARSTRLAMFLSAIWATCLSGYGGLPAVLAEACVFQLAARFNGACSGSFLPFLGGETCALWREGCSRGLGGGFAFGDVRSGFGCQLGGCGLVGTCVACVSRLGEGEGELEGTTYCTRTRGAWSLVNSCRLMRLQWQTLSTTLPLSRG